MCHCPGCRKLRQWEQTARFKGYVPFLRLRVWWYLRLERINPVRWFGPAELLTDLARMIL